ncbi:nitroreductase family protein [Isoalcanivorax beigongshangi]|uniref:Putative NAD(P)H nitroreductase n=1 Tax=Isoalcanivorax beigongshangi TaxID=3238810 RepID=A0ABV4AKI4_9GAMM
MELLDALRSRVSVGQLAEPGPSAAQLTQMLEAALRAPDHGVLRRTRFMVVSGADRARLGDWFVAAQLAQQPETSAAACAKLRSNPLRAPTILIVVADVLTGDRIPVIDQVLTAGAAAQNILLAAHGMGLGAMWRTGDMATNPHLKRQLGFSEQAEIVGFLYLGTPSGSVKKVPAEEVGPYLRALPHD